MRDTKDDAAKVAGMQAAFQTAKHGERCERCFYFHQERHAVGTEDGTCLFEVPKLLLIPQAPSPAAPNGGVAIGSYSPTTKSYKRCHCFRPAVMDA